MPTRSGAMLTLRRFIALFLVLGLMADTARAQTFRTPFSHPLKNSAFLFVDQALSPEAVAEETGPMNAASRVAFINHSPPGIRFMGAYLRTNASGISASFRFILPAEFRSGIEGLVHVWVKKMRVGDHGIIQITPFYADSAKPEPISMFRKTSRRIAIPRAFIDEIDDLIRKPFYVIGTRDKIELWLESTWHQFYKQLSAQVLPIAEPFDETIMGERKVTQDQKIHQLLRPAVKHLELSTIEEKLILEAKQEGRISIEPSAVWLDRVERNTPTNPTMLENYQRLTYARAYVTNITQHQYNLALPKSLLHMVSIKPGDRVQLIKAGPRRIDLQLLSTDPNQHRRGWNLDFSHNAPYWVMGSLVWLLPYFSSISSWSAALIGILIILFGPRIIQNVTQRERENPWGIQATDRIFVVPDALFDTFKHALATLGYTLGGSPQAICFTSDTPPFSRRFYEGALLPSLKVVDHQLYARVTTASNQGFDQLNALFGKLKTIIIKVSAVDNSLSSRHILRHEIGQLLLAESPDLPWLLEIYERMAKNRDFRWQTICLFGHYQPYVDQIKRGDFGAEYWSSFLSPVFDDASVIRFADKKFDERIQHLLQWDPTLSSDEMYRLRLVLTALKEAATIQAAQEYSYVLQAATLLKTSFSAHGPISVRRAV